MIRIFLAFLVVYLCGVIYILTSKDFIFNKRINIEPNFIYSNDSFEVIAYPKSEYQIVHIKKVN